MPTKESVRTLRILPSTPAHPSERHTYKVTRTGSTNILETVPATSVRDATSKLGWKIGAPNYPKKALFQEVFYRNNRPDAYISQGAAKKNFMALVPKVFSVSLA